MKNKGFSMVELIVVIAIMAILAGALAPALMKYIAKSRLSTDIETGREIATAIMAAVVNDSAYSGAVDHDSTPQAVNQMDGPDFKREVFNILGVDTVVGKSRKDVDGSEFSNREFYYTLDAEKNKVQIYYGATTADYQVYPSLGSKLFED